MASQAVQVEEVARGKALARFIELPVALHHADPRWAPPVMAYERWRLDPPRNPFFDDGDARYLLARRLGKPAGRMTAHIATEGGEGCFGLYDAIDDPAVVAALVDAAHAWLSEQGCTSMTGPLSFTARDEAGVVVAGHDVAGVTGRQWHPTWYASLLEGAGFVPAGDVPTWRLQPREGMPIAPSDAHAPPHAGSYADPRLVLPAVAAVPDIAGPLRGHGPRSAWALAKQAKARAWEGCTIVRCDGDPATLVPQIQDAAARAGYRWVIAPWSPDPEAEPEVVHRTYRLRW